MKNRQLASTDPGKPRKESSSGRPRLPRVSEETRRLAALLVAEILHWPDVSSRPMFGMMALYRNRTIFAALPRTRALDTPDTIGFRLARFPPRVAARLSEDERIIRAGPGGKWVSFVLQSDADVHDALKWIDLAYRQANE